MRLASLNPNLVSHQVDVDPFQCCNVPKPLPRVQAETNNALPFPVSDGKYGFELFHGKWPAHYLARIKPQSAHAFCGVARQKSLPSGVFEERFNRLHVKV